MVDIVLTSDLLKHRQQMTPEIIGVQKLHTGSKATGNTEMFAEGKEQPWFIYHQIFISFS